MGSKEFSKPAPDFLTFDVEDWYMANYDDEIPSYPASASRIDWETDRLLSLCDDYRIKATCFCVGKLAEERPEIVRKFHQAGHEIASHGYGHRVVYRMTPEAFKADLNKSIRILEDCTGDKIKGFRAPSWSVKSEILPWFYSILEEAGITYSSSVYPAQTYLFGIRGFPEIIHRPEVAGCKTSVFEVPQILTSIFGQKVGFSGGFFTKTFPSLVYKSNAVEEEPPGEAGIHIRPPQGDRSTSCPPASEAA